MIVMKFGGTSVGSAERIKNTSAIINSRLESKPIVIVSAVTKVTDMLIKLANECSLGHGSETLEIIQNTHKKILAELNLQNSVLENDFRELSGLFNK